MKPALSLIRTPAEPAPTYATVPETAVKRFDELAAKVRRLRSTFGGSFTTSAKLSEADKELADCEALIRATRSSLRSGR